MKVHVSTHLRGYTQNRREVEGQGATLDELTRDLDRQFPGLRFRIIDEQDQIREHIKVFVNAQQTTRMSLPLQPADQIHIIGALSGGSVPDPRSHMQTTGLDHVVLTIADSERSRGFYGDLLGFEVSTLPEGGFYFKVGDVWYFLLPSRQPLAGDRFSEFRIGLDHLSFRAPSREALNALAAKLKAAGVDTKGVEQFAPTGNWYVAFRDPDNVQLEYWLP